jgi:hypothetical protein
MIQIDTVREIDDKSQEGMLLVAALAILTSIQKDDINENGWGGLVSPDEGIRKIQDLANRIYYKEEWESQKKSKERDKKIDDVLDEESES